MFYEASPAGNIRSGIVQFQSTQQQQVFQNPIGLQQQNLVGLQQMANNMNNSLNPQLTSNTLFQQVAYPRVNTQAFQTNITGNMQNNSNSTTKQKVITGKVTQLQDKFGLVDDEILFQLNACVKGQVPSVGDKVLVEACYMPNMHFKWNATRIQSLNNQQRNAKNYNSRNYNSGNDRGVRKMMNRRDRSRDKDDELERKRRREDRIKEKEKEERNKSPVRRRSRSPKVRRRPRIVPRYMVQVPRITLDM